MCVDDEAPVDCCVLAVDGADGADGEGSRGGAYYWHATVCRLLSDAATLPPGPRPCRWRSAGCRAALDVPPHGAYSGFLSMAASCRTASMTPGTSSEESVGGDVGVCRCRSGGMVLRGVFAGPPPGPQSALEPRKGLRMKLSIVWRAACVSCTHCPHTSSAHDRRTPKSVPLHMHCRMTVANQNAQQDMTVGFWSEKTNTSKTCLSGFGPRKPHCRNMTGTASDLA